MTPRLVCCLLSWLLLAGHLLADEEESGFVPLLNGQSLDGWIGAVDDYRVEDGVLRCLPGQGGKLFTAEEFGDFVLRFEFKLTPAANNGLGIRTPAEGDPAYAGIELQILDNSAAKWADLKAYQYHGSAYGVAPAERGHLLPVGEWNKQEVRAEGRQITVVLNGHTILDIDLDEVAPGGKTIDGHDHPGVGRERGHLGFLGHGDEVFFRNIRIKKLDP